MSHIARDINKITGTIIGVSGKLIVYALVILLLVEGMTKGYAFGHDVFCAKALEEAPGTDKVVTIPKGQTPSETAQLLKDVGLIESELAAVIQMKFYEYDANPGTYTLNTSMTSKEILQALNEKRDTEEESGDGTGTSGKTGQTSGSGSKDSGKAGESQSAGSRDSEKAGESQTAGGAGRDSGTAELSEENYDTRIDGDGEDAAAQAGSDRLSINGGDTGPEDGGEPDIRIDVP